MYWIYEFSNFQLGFFIVFFYLFVGIILTEFLGTLSEYHAKSEEQKIILAEVFTEYNRLIEARRIRLDAANAGGVPGVFWIVIISGSLLTIIMTYFYHLSSLKTHVVLTGFYTAALGLMIFLILTVDNPFRCATSVSSAPYADVLNDLENLDPVQLKSNDSHM